MVFITYSLLQTDQGVEYLSVTPGNSLYFPAVDFINQSVGNAGIKQGSSQVPVIVDCRYILGADFTAAKVNILETAKSIKIFEKYLQDNKTFLVFLDAGYKNVN